MDGALFRVGVKQPAACIEDIFHSRLAEWIRQAAANCKLKIKGAIVAYSSKTAHRILPVNSTKEGYGVQVSLPYVIVYMRGAKS